ncbi:MAG: signal peptidase II [Actinomycetes bacterium]
MAPRRRLLVATSIVLLVVALDVLTKTWAVRALSDGPLWLVGRSIGFVLSFNSGSAFSIVQSGAPVLAVIALIAAGVLVRSVLRTEDLWLVVGLSLVLAGAVGNLIDRVFRAPSFLHGAVIDFVKVGPWPLFNVADSAISVGAVIIVVRVLLDGRERPDPAPIPGGGDT